jgi:hypothetical protein
MNKFIFNRFIPLNFEKLARRYLPHFNDGCTGKDSFYSLQYAWLNEYGQSAILIESLKKIVYRIYRHLTKYVCAKT